MSRVRTKDKDLPKRVYKKSGAYYFFPVEPMLVKQTGKVRSWIKLCPIADGKTKMREQLALLIGGAVHTPGTMPFICDDFKTKKLEKYTPTVRDQYSRYLDVIAEEFEDFRVDEVTTKEFSDFLYERFGDKPNTAKKYARLAVKLFKYAISRHGLRQDNPIDQLDLSDFVTGRREVLPTHAQVAKIREHGLSSAPRVHTGAQFPTCTGPMFACIVDMAYLLWARAIDIRLLHESQIDGGRIRIQASKTRRSSGKIVDFVITPQIQDVIDRARAVKSTYDLRRDQGYLFCTRSGTAYTRSGLFSMWDRARARAGINEDVQFRDLRALGATDALKAGESRKGIQTRLAHTSEKTTEIYLKVAVADASLIEMDLPWLKSRL